MKKKILKVTGVTFLLVLVAVIVFFANAFLGNPVSKAIATNTAKKHLAEAYADTDYYVDDVRYNFKNGDYHAFIKSPSSIDTEFSFYITMTGKLRLDTYEDVENGFNTARRLDMQYRALADEIFYGENFPYTCYISYGSLEIHPDEYINSGYDDIPAYAINQNELELDKQYDIRELGRKAGRIVVYAEEDTVNTEKAAEIMLGIKAIFDEADLPFAAMDFVLEHLKPVAGDKVGEEVRVENFLYDEIKQENFAERIAEADKALKEKYAEMDKEAGLLTSGDVDKV